MVPPLALGGMHTPSSPTAAGGEGGDVFSPLTSPKMRRNTFAATLDLIDALCEASARLAVIPQGDERKEELKQMLVEINEALGSPEAAGSACLYPLGDGNERVLHIPPQEAILLNSKDRAPFMLFLEVLEERPGHAGGMGGSETPPSPGPPSRAQSSAAALGGGSDVAEGAPRPSIYGGSVRSSVHDLRQRRASLEDQPISEAIDTAMANLSVDSALLREKATTPKKGPVGGLLDSLYGGVRGRSRSSSLVTENSSAPPAEQAGAEGLSSPSPGRTSAGDSATEVSPDKPTSPHEDRLPLPQKRGKGHARVPSADAIQAMYLKYNRSDMPNVEELIEGIEAAQEAADEGSHHSVEAEARQEEALKVYGEKFSDKQKRVRASSPYGHLPGWKLQSVIVKAGDDCRQELMALQLLQQFKNIFMEAGLPLYIRDYAVLVTSSESGLIETVVDSLSIHTIKSNSGTSLRRHFEDKFVKGSREFLQAQRNFVESMAAYSVVCYLLQVKDRHNSNILIDQEGRLIHIDFGFMLSNSPGGINFETAPFKLTREILEVMDSDAEGKPSELFDYYKVLVIQGFLACRKHSEQITVLIDIMHKSGFPCFKAGRRALAALKKRFCLNKPEDQCVEHVLDLLSESLDAWRTRQYDYFQRVSNGIL
jgi:phosphatidylinositol 4-kinase